MNEHLAGKVEPEKHISMMWFHRLIRGHIGRKAELTMNETPRITIMPRATFIAEIDWLDTETVGRHFKQTKHHRMRHPFDTGFEIGATRCRNIQQKLPGGSIRSQRAYDLAGQNAGLGPVLAGFGRLETIVSKQNLPQALYALRPRYPWHVIGFRVHALAVQREPLPDRRSKGVGPIAYAIKSVLARHFPEDRKVPRYNWQLVPRSFDKRETKSLALRCRNEARRHRINLLQILVADIFKPEKTLV